jgi:hypothetical protein
VFLEPVDQFLHMFGGSPFADGTVALVEEPRFEKLRNSPLFKALNSQGMQDFVNIVFKGNFGAGTTLRVQLPHVAAPEGENPLVLFLLTYPIGSRSVFEPVMATKDANGNFTNSSVRFVFQTFMGYHGVDAMYDMSVATDTFPWVVPYAHGASDLVHRVRIKEGGDRYGMKVKPHVLINRLGASLGFRWLDIMQPYVRMLLETFSMKVCLIRRIRSPCG